jgi:hypothetical protein
MDSPITGSAAARAQVSAIRFQAAQLLATLSPSAPSRGGAGGELLLNLGIRELVPYGWRGTSRKIVSGLQRSSKIAAEGRIQQQIGALVSESRAFAASHSIVNDSLRSGPNSGKLLRRFGASLDHGSPSARLRSLVTALDAIARLDLVPNQEVLRILESRRFDRARQRVEKGSPKLGTVLRQLPGPQDSAYYEARLAAFKLSPAVTESIDGAIARLNQGGPDAFRQGVSSIRVAFDALINELTHEGDWKQGLVRLVTSDEERDIAKKFHHMLSKSDHPGAPTSKETLQLSLEMFAVFSTRLVQLRGDQTRSTGTNS